MTFPATTSQQGTGDPSNSSPANNERGRRIKVAVIGSGLAGLTAAYALAKANQVQGIEDAGVSFEVHLFEKAPSLGMDAGSVSVPMYLNKGSKRTVGELRVDVPMRSFQGGYYPQLISLYRHLGVQFRRADFTYSFNTIKMPTSFSPTKKLKMRTTMLYNGQNGRRGLGIPSEYLTNNEEKLVETSPLTILEGWITSIPYLLVFAFWTLCMFISYLRLIRLSSPIYRKWRPAGKEERLDEWMERTRPYGRFGNFLRIDRAWEDFVRSMIIPLFSAVCTAPEEDIWAHPVSEILDYVWQGLFTPHYVVTSGVQDVVNRLSAPLDPSCIHLSSPITSISKDKDEPSKISIRFTDEATQEELVSSGFSHVVFATQANQAATILADYQDRLPPKSDERYAVDELVSCLKRFKYQRNIVINHRDNDLLPSNPQDWRDLNLFCAENHDPTTTNEKVATDPHCVAPSFTMATHIISPEPFDTSNPSSLPTSRYIYQTTNPIIPPHPNTIISVVRMERAVLTVDSKAAVRLLSADGPRLGSRVWWKRLIGKRRKPRSKVLGPLQGAGKRAASTSDDEGEWSSSRPGIWLCGSYSHGGIPLLEGCVGSARNIIENGIMAAEGLDHLSRKGPTEW